MSISPSRVAAAPSAGGFNDPESQTIHNVLSRYGATLANIRPYTPQAGSFVVIYRDPEGTCYLASGTPNPRGQMQLNPGAHTIQKLTDMDSLGLGLARAGDTLTYLSQYDADLAYRTAILPPYAAPPSYSPSNSWFSSSASTAQQLEVRFGRPSTASSSGPRPDTPLPPVPERRRYSNRNPF